MHRSSAMQMAQCNNEAAAGSSSTVPQGSKSINEEDVPTVEDCQAVWVAEGGSHDHPVSFPAGFEEHTEILVDVAEDMHHAHGLPCNRTAARAAINEAALMVLKVRFVSVASLHCQKIGRAHV